MAHKFIPLMESQCLIFIIDFTKLEIILIISWVYLHFLAHCDVHFF